jgi:hypothetical protein
MDSASDVAYYLAEWYLPELTDQSVDAIVAKSPSATKARRSGWSSRSRYQRMKFYTVSSAHNRPTS